MKKALHILFLILITTSISYAWSWKDKKEASITEIMNGTVTIKEDLKEISIDYIKKGANESVDLINELKEDVASKNFFGGDKTDKEKFEIMYKGIKEIRDFYIALDSRKSDVRDEFTGSIQNIREYMISVNKKVSIEEKELEKLKNELNNSKLIYTGKKREIKEKELKDKIFHSQLRNKLMKDFFAEYKDFEKNMYKIYEEIDIFIFILLS